MVKCRGCGVSLPRDARYCFNCGSRVGRRGILAKLVPIFLVIALLMLALGSPLTNGGNVVLERVRAAGFNAMVERGGYVAVVADHTWSVVDFVSLEKVLKEIDARWVILRNMVERGDADKAQKVADMVNGLEDVRGVYRDGGLVMVTVKTPSAQLLHMIFKLAGQDVALVIRFS
ncbi:MAG: zinc ribbon domain-containing protein [Candidatus Caldarchaeum sp.]